VSMPHNLPLVVVGIGASAGGLQAYTELLESLPPNTGMAFVIVQHLAAEHESLLATLLSRATPMPVVEVHDEPRVEPNCIYVIPPNRSMHRKSRVRRWY
jgi:two-component system CheB/CheR fusion protein